MERYFRDEEFDRDLEELNNKIKDMQEGNQNIIKHSIVEDVEKSIDKMNTKIRNTKIHNGMNILVRNIRLFGNLLHLAYPHIIAASIAFIIPLAAGDLPFVRQEKLNYGYHEVVMDNIGNVKDDIVYEQNMPTSKGHIRVTTSWKQHDDGKYYRKIEEYSFNQIPVDKLQAQLEENNYSFVDILGDPVKANVEVKNELPKDAEARDGYVEIYYKYGDKDMYEMIPQDAGENAVLSVLYVLLAICNCGFVHTVRSEISYYDFWDNREDIYRDYKNPDMKYAMKQFREKSKAFKQMKKNNFEPILEVERNFQKKKTMK